ncbi:MAG: HlyD family secretion protein [Prevotella sp.]
MKANILFAVSLVIGMTACTSSEKGYDASGVFETTEVIVSAKGTGELISFNVEEGQEVRQYDVIGSIDTTQLVLKNRQLSANLLATQDKTLDESRQVASLRQQIANLQKEKQRYAALLASDAATQKQVDDLDYQIGVLNRQLAASLEQLGSNNRSIANQAEGIRAMQAQTDDQLRNSIITSPISGTVLAKYAERGEYATPGKPLFKVSDVKSMKLRAYVTAPQLTTLKIGQEVTVYADYGEKESKAYKGIVEWISDKAEFTPKTIQTRDERANLVYAVKIAVKNDGMIKRGMYGNVKF